MSTRETQAGEQTHLQIAQKIQYKDRPIPSWTQPFLFLGSGSTHDDSRIDHDVQDASEARACLVGVRRALVEKGGIIDLHDFAQELGVVDD